MEPSVAGRTIEVLVVGDSEAVHDEFRGALCRPSLPCSAGTSPINTQVSPDHAMPGDRFQLSYAVGTLNALAALRSLELERRTLHVGFVDQRDVGSASALDTVRALWEAKCTLNLVLCIDRYDDGFLNALDLGAGRDHLVLLRRPFYPLEVRQLALVLSGHSRQPPATGQSGGTELDELFARAEQLKLLVDNASDFLYQRTETGHMLYISPGFCRMLGLPSAEWERQYPTLVADAKQLNPYADLPVVQMLDAEQRTHWLELDERLMITGHLRQFVGVARDITKQRTLEQVLRSTQKLESVGRFAGGLAHDFNNLLTVIAGHAEMLRLNGPSEDTEGIRNATQQASELTRRLLMFSRDAPVAAELVDVNQLIRESSRMFGRLIRDDIRLDLVFGEDVGKVHISPSELARVVMNLVLNASDAMPKGGNLRIATQRVPRSPLPATTTATTKPEQYCDDMVVIRVSDTGIGMSAEVSERIFDPFFTTKGVGQGTGLGLSVVLGIVQQARGSIRVESRSGEGTTFELTLPGCADEASRADPGPHGSPAGAGQHVLVVDDNALVADLTAKVLKRAGYSVHVTASADEAIRLIAESPRRYRLLVSDVIMPNMSGPELYSRAARITPNLAVLFMSGYAAQSLTDEPIDWERATFLPKPWTPNELLVAAHHAIHRWDVLDRERSA